MIRKLIAKFSKSINEHIAARRYEYHVPIKITFEPNRNTGNLQVPLNSLSIRGETQDISESGIAFIVPSIRLREHYLVGEGHTLNAELDLPNGKVKMRVMGQRYEQIGQHISTIQYLIGAKILSMTETDREIYNEFLKEKNHKTGSLEFVDER